MKKFQNVRGRKHGSYATVKHIVGPLSPTRTISGSRICGVEMKGKTLKEKVE